MGGRCGKKQSKTKRETRKHQQIARARKDHAYSIAHSLVRSDKKVFFVENLNLRGLRKRNKTKKAERLRRGLNKSWSDASFGQFFDTFSYIAEKAGAVVKKVNPAYTSQLLSYRDEFVFTDCSIRTYYDSTEQIIVDRDINSAINLKRVGLELFPTINRRSGKIVKTQTNSNSTTKEVLGVLKEIPEAYAVSLDERR